MIISGSWTMAHSQFGGLPHPGGIPVDTAVALFTEADVFEALVRTLHGHHRIHPEQFTGVTDLMNAVHARIKRLILGHVSNALANAGALGTDVMPQHVPLT